MVIKLAERVNFISHTHTGQRKYTAATKFPYYRRIVSSALKEVSKLAHVLLSRFLTFSGMKKATSADTKIGR